MPATPSVTSPFSITPLFSRWSSRSRIVDSGPSSTYSTTTGATARFEERATSVLHEGVGRPRTGDGQAVSLALERLRFARRQRLKRCRARARHEERGVEQQRTAVHRHLTRRTPASVARPCGQLVE